MHYLLTVIGDTANPVDDTEPGAVDRFNDRMKSEGRWVFAGGLTDPADATVTDSRGGQPVFSDGPFVESKEFLAGFWVITADDLDEALALSVDASTACNRKIEVRPFDGVA
jgi:hypothetical protein